MIFTTTFCLVLALSSTLAEQNAVQTLENQISSKVVDGLVQAAKAAKAVKTSAEELKNKMVQATQSSLEALKSRIQELKKLGGTVKELLKNLALKIKDNKTLPALLPSSEGKKTPRGKNTDKAVDAFIPLVVSTAEKLIDSIFGAFSG